MHLNFTRRKGLEIHACTRFGVASALVFAPIVLIWMPSPARRLPRCCGFYRKRVKTGVQFGLQESIHGSVPVDPAHSRKCRGHDANPHMGLAFAGYVGLMPGMMMALVDHLQPFGREVVAKRSFDSGSDGQFFSSGVRRKRGTQKPATNRFVNSCSTLSAAP
jgi:hypothetical protein